MSIIYKRIQDLFNASPGTILLQLADDDATTIYKVNEKYCNYDAMIEWSSPGSNH